MVLLTETDHPDMLYSAMANRSFRNLFFLLAFPYLGDPRRLLDQKDEELTGKGLCKNDPETFSCLALTSTASS